MDVEIRILVLYMKLLTMEVVKHTIYLPTYIYIYIFVVNEHTLYAYQDT